MSRNRSCRAKSRRVSADAPRLRSGRAGEAGFTLVELLIALLIFGMLSAAGVALLSFSVRAQDAADERLGELAQIRRAGALLTADLAQAAPRLTRDDAGSARPAFAGGTGQGEPVSLRLVRRGYRYLAGAEPMPPVTLVEGVRTLRLRYRDDEGEWRDRWDPPRPTALPRAVELVMDVASGGTIRQLFLTGAGA